jgi:tetratricopeptide (TPR) repeat protein
MTPPYPDPELLWEREPAELIAAITDVLRQVRDSSDPDGFEWLLMVAEQAMGFGLNEISTQLLQACRTLLPTLIDHPARASLTARLDNLDGLLALRTGHLADSDRYLRAAARESHELGDELGEALAHQNLAAVLWELGAATEAREHASTALAAYERMSDPVRRAQVLLNLANFDLDEGRTEDAETRLGEAARLATTPLASGVRLSILGTRALIARARGDQTSAGALHRQVLRRARRTGDLGRLRVATQNLAAWYAEMGKPLRASSWLGRAADLATREGNTSLAAQLLRAQAVQLFTAKRTDDATSVMRRALDLSNQAGDLQGEAEAEADLGAFLINVASNKVTTNANTDRVATLDEAATLLEAALEYFRTVANTAWTERVRGNLASLALAQGKPLSALERLTAARESLPFDDIAGRVEIDRRAASIAIRDARRPDLAAQFVRHAASLLTAASPVPESLPDVRAFVFRFRPRAVAPAWELALGAAQLREYPFGLPFALELFEEARVAASLDDALLFHITNDLGSTYYQGSDTESAIQCFETCLAIAERLSDRVMQQQALANQAEMARRRGQPDAIQLFGRAISLAKDLGDVQAQIESLLNMASAYVDELRPDEARSTVDQAEALLDRAETPAESASRLLSIRGNISWEQNDFEAAGSLYRAAAARSDGSDRIESLAAALLTLAKTRQRDPYRRDLARLTREAQRTGCDGVLAEGLLPSAEEWLHAEARQLCGRTYADAIELALVQCAHDMPVEIEDQEAPTLPLSEADSLLSGDSRLDLLVRVIVRTAVGISAVPAIGPGVTRHIATRLRHDLPSGVNEILVDWLQQASSVVQKGISSQSAASADNTGSAE